MPSQYAVPFFLPLPQHHFVDAVTQALKEIGFPHPTNSTTFSRLSATLKVHQRPFEYEFTASVSWSPTNDGIQATLSITEAKQGDMIHRCKARCDQFMKVIEPMVKDAIPQITTQPVSNRYGSARWAEIPDDLENADFLTTRAANDRFLLAKLDGRYISVPAKITDAHTAIIGPAGSGKSTGFLIPNLIERYRTSMIVTEATNNEEEQADIFNKTAGFRRDMGHEIHWFNPTLANSTRINPLDSITDAIPDKRLLEAQKLAHLIIQNGQDRYKKDDHWDKSAYLLLIALFMQVVEGIDDRKYKHFGTVLELLRLGPDGLNEYIAQSPSERAKQRYEIFYNNSGPGHSRGVISTLVPKLDSWITPQVIRLTSKTDVSLEQLSKQLFTFYLSVPSTRDDLKPLTAMIFNYLLGILKYRPFKEPVALLLDEFSNFGYIPSFHSIYTTIRKSGVPFVLGFQDQAQLEDVYNRNKSRIILNNTATKVFLTPSPNDNVQGRLISEALDKKTETEIITSPTGQTITREYGRFLMTTGEVLSMGKQYALVFSTTTTGNLPPMKITKFHPAEYEWAEKQSTPPTRPDHVLEDILFPLPTIEKKANTEATYQSRGISRSKAERAPKRKSQGPEITTENKSELGPNLPSEIQEKALGRDDYGEMPDDFFS